MWASPRRNNNNSSYIASCSPSKSPSSSTCSSSPAPCSPPSPIIPNLLAKKSMEEVWKDISLASLIDHPAGTIISTTTNNPTFPSMILQDLLARPFNKEPPRRSSGVSSDTSLAEETTLFSSLAPTPGTILGLNCGSDFQYIESGDPVRPNQAANARIDVATPSFGSSQNSAFHVFCSSAVYPFCQTRAQEKNENSDDRWHKRMIKSRESAARSRARKQAYTNELELEVALLLEENAKLRRQQEKLLAAAAQLSKKKTLSRTLTAPF